jgi:beta-lactamase regulating signal transducer with metallopeptidase domain
MSYHQLPTNLYFKKVVNIYFIFTLEIYQCNELNENCSDDSIDYIIVSNLCHLGNDSLDIIIIVSLKTEIFSKGFKIVFWFPPLFK